MNINIYRAGSVVTTLPVADNAECKRNMQGVDEITMEVVQTTGSMPVQIGDYIIFENRNYYLNQPATLEKRSEVEYQLRLVFEANIYALLNKLFQQPVTGRGDFALTDELNGFVDVLLENINGIDSGWTKGSIPTTERKLMTFDGENCRAVLNRLADDFDVEFVVIGKQIAFYDIYETATSLVFEHGKGKGLYQLTRENVDSDNTVTRGWFWGSTKNIDYTYRDGETRLMFTNPATGTNRIDNFGEFAKVVEKQVIFEDVWPHFTGTIATVSNNTTTRTHSFTCPQIDFDVWLQFIEGITGKVFFKSGDLQSQEFEIKSYDHATRTITLITYTDEFGGVWPNDAKMPRVGDQFTFIDIMMPSAYVAAAEAELAAKAADWMAYYSKLRVKYRLDLDPRYLRNNAITLNLGDVVRIVDSALGIDRQIRITSIEKDIANPYRVKCEISNILEERWDKKISKKVQEAINTAKSATEKSSSIAGSAASTFFSRYFEIRGSAGNEYICAKYPFASVGDITAFAASGAIPSLWEGMPTASATIKGGIRIGTGLTIDANGVVSVDGEAASGRAVLDSFTQIGNASDVDVYLKIITDSKAWWIGAGIVSSDDCFVIYDASRGYHALSINTSTGNIGIGLGTTAASQKLHVGGNIYATGTVTWSSDKRLKRNILPIHDALRRCEAIRGYTYIKCDTAEAGLIAQEVMRVLPEAVIADNNGFFAMNYGAVVALHTQAINELGTWMTNTGIWQSEQNKEVESLKKRVSELENREKFKSA